MHPYRTPPELEPELVTRALDGNDGGFWIGVALLATLSVGRIVIALVRGETWGVEPTSALLVLAFGLHSYRRRR